MTKKFNDGMKEMRKHFGKVADSWIESLREISPEFAKVNVEFPFGELYTRAALTVQGFSLPELKVHTVGALNCGASRDEILEVVTQMLAYCGFPAATNALQAVNEVFVDLDKK